jgi:hypothetical protein
MNYIRLLSPQVFNLILFCIINCVSASKKEDTFNETKAERIKTPSHDDHSNIYLKDINIGTTSKYE